MTPSDTKSCPVLALKPWEVIDFPHFVGVRHRNGPWSTVLLKPTGKAIDFEAMGVRVKLHDNGIEWLSRESA